MEISEGSDVWITTNGQRQVSQSVDTPRSYVIVTPRGRNRTQLNVAPAIAQESNEQSNTTEPPDSNPEVPRRIMTNGNCSPSS